MIKEKNILEDSIKLLKNFSQITSYKVAVGIVLDCFKILTEENEELKHQLELSEQNRLKAIEYINKYSNKGYNFGWVLQNEEIDRLLEILGE